MNHQSASSVSIGRSRAWSPGRGIEEFLQAGRARAWQGIRQIAKAWVFWAQFIFQGAVAAFARILNTSIVRRVGRGQRSLERHEFESVETRRGGFGNVF